MCFGCRPSKVFVGIDKLEELEVWVEGGDAEEEKTEEPTYKLSENKRIHVVLGKEKAESGNYYNELVFNYLRSRFNGIYNSHNFDLEKKLINFRNDTIKDYYVNTNISFKIE